MSIHLEHTSRDDFFADIIQPQKDDTLFAVSTYDEVQYFATQWEVHTTACRLSEDDPAGVWLLWEGCWLPVASYNGGKPEYHSYRSPLQSYVVLTKDTEVRILHRDALVTQQDWREHSSWPTRQQAEQKKSALEQLLTEE